MGCVPSRCIIVLLEILDTAFTHSVSWAKDKRTIRIRRSQTQGVAWAPAASKAGGTGINPHALQTALPIGFRGTVPRSTDSCFVHCNVTSIFLNFEGAGSGGYVTKLPVIHPNFNHYSQLTFPHPINFVQRPQTFSLCTAYTRRCPFSRRLGPRRHLLGYRLLHLRCPSHPGCFSPFNR